MLCRDIGRAIIEHFETVDIDYNKIVQTNALDTLQGIKEIICNETLDDFMKIDEIVNVFIKYNIDSGGCHDFGWVFFEN